MLSTQCISFTEHTSYSGEPSHFARFVRTFSCVILSHDSPATGCQFATREDEIVGDYRLRLAGMLNLEI